MSGENALAHVKNPSVLTNVAPTAARRFALHFSIGQDMHTDLVYAQELLSHQIPPVDLEEVFGRALKALIREAEKAKFAATDRPQRVARKNTNPRHIPNRVKRQVWQRDGGQCTFVSEDGHRCESRRLIEYDHVEEVARGGRATVGGIQLRCRAHDQFTAEQTIGREFMENKREEARQAAERAKELDVIPWLRKLGIRADEAQRLSTLCESIPDAPIEQRPKYALSCLDTRARLRQPAAA